MLYNKHNLTQGSENMDIELTGFLRGAKLESWKKLLQQAGLEADEQVQRTALIWEDGELIATGSRQDNLLKCIAVGDTHQGEGLTATLLTDSSQRTFCIFLREMHCQLSRLNHLTFFRLRIKHFYWYIQMIANLIDDKFYRHLLS